MRYISPFFCQVLHDKKLNMTYVRVTSDKLLKQ